MWFQWIGNTFWIFRFDFRFLQWSLSNDFTSSADIGYIFVSQEICLRKWFECRKTNANAFRQFFNQIWIKSKWNGLENIPTRTNSFYFTLSNEFTISFAWFFIIWFQYFNFFSSEIRICVKDLLKKVEISWL